MGGVRKRTRIKGLWETEGGHYHARLRVQGKPKWVVLGTDYEAAKKKLHRYRGGEPIPSRVSVAEAAEDWLKLAVKTRRNEKGHKLATTWKDLYLCRYFTGLLGSIDDDSIRRYRLWLEKKRTRKQASQNAPEKGLSANTVARILSDLRAFLGWCVDSGRLERTPFPRRVMPRIPETAPKGFTDAERAILVALPEPHGFMMRFMLGTGLRYGEGCHAQASHVKDGVLEVEKTKSGKVRRVPLPDALAAEVRKRVGRMVPYSPVSTGSINRTIKRLSDQELQRPPDPARLRDPVAGG